MRRIWVESKSHITWVQNSVGVANAYMRIGTDALRQTRCASIRFTAQQNVLDVQRHFA